MDREQLEVAIRAQEQLRGVVADEIIDATIAMLRQQVTDLDATTTRRRRQVTVLFADVSGFTAMSERMDAENVTEMMNDVWTRLDEVIVDHGGTIDKHIGDSVMAVWGSEGIHEGDPERAVRAALRLLEALDQFRSDSGLGLRMRVGVNTGPALLGSVGSTRELTAMGDTVNVASRLETAAPLDRILISHDTFRHVRGVFDVQPEAPLVVKGKTEALRTYLVRSVKPRAFRLPSRGVEGVETRMVGRDVEIDSLCALFEDVASTSTAHLVSVIGEAGVGKSRLLWEFDNWLELQPRTVVYYKGRALMQRRDVPLALLRDVIASRFEVTDGDSPSHVLERFIDATAGVLDAFEASTLALWLGFDVTGLAGVPDALNGERLAIAGRTYLAEFLKANLARAPVVMLLEDLHWADDDSLSCLRALLEELDALPLLIVGATRPELLDAHPDWPQACHRNLTVELAPLTAGQTRELVREILQLADVVPASLEDLVVERADGNSFYIEELVQMLIDDKVIDTMTADGVWRVDASRVNADQVPSTLVGVLQARLDGLPAAARVSLQSASVIGRIFWDSAVHAVSDAPPRLAAIVSRELVFARSQSTFAGCEEYIFKHALLHDVAYDTVLLSDRPLLHARAAEWLDRNAGERRDEYLVEIARHLMLAGELARAAVALDAAAAVALDTGNLRSARRLAENALEQWRSTDVEPPVDSLTRLARACTMLGDLPAARQIAMGAVGRARGDSGSSLLLVNALHAASEAAHKLGDDDESRVLLEEALPIAEDVGGAALGRVLVGLTWCAFGAGDLDEALRHVTRSLELAQTTQDAQLTVSAYLSSAAILEERGDLDGSVRHAELAVAVSRASGDLVSEARAIGNAGVSWHLRGDAERDAERASADYRTAHELYLQSLELSERLGMRDLEATALGNMAQVAIRLGDIDAAASLSIRSLELALRIGSRLSAIAAVLFHAEALIAGGDTAALDHIGLIHQQPSLGDLQGEVDRIINRLRKAGVPNVDEGLARGASLDFGEVVNELLRR